jgi:hypothetical protein
LSFAAFQPLLKRRRRGRVRGRGRMADAGRGAVRCGG